MASSIGPQYVELELQNPQGALLLRAGLEVLSA
jgi:hypothetical protein